MVPTIVVMAPADVFASITGGVGLVLTVVASALALLSSLTERAQLRRMREAGRTRDKLRDVAIKLERAAGSTPQPHGHTRHRDEQVDDLVRLTYDLRDLQATHPDLSDDEIRRILRVVIDSRPGARA